MARYSVKRVGVTSQDNPPIYLPRPWAIFAASPVDREKEKTGWGMLITAHNRAESVPLSYSFPFFARVLLLCSLIQRAV